MNRYLLKLAYNGSRYHGWQIQDNAHSVQAEISDKLSVLLKGDISLVGCGRTDTGVHAKQFYAHFDFADLEWNFMDLIYKLNSFLSNQYISLRTSSILSSKFSSSVSKSARVLPIIFGSSISVFFLKKNLR